MTVLSGLADILARKALRGDDRRKRIKLVAFDFDGVFTDNTVYTFTDGSEAIRCWRSDGVGLRKLERAGIAAVIITQEGNPVVARRAQKLGIKCYAGVEDKLACLRQVTEGLGVEMGNVAFVGNDEPDVPCLDAVGMPVIVADAEITINTYLKLSRPGGKGAVREFCDWLVAGL